MPSREFLDKLALLAKVAEAVMEGAVVGLLKKAQLDFESTSQSNPRVFRELNRIIEELAKKSDNPSIEGLAAADAFVERLRAMGLVIVPDVSAVEVSNLSPSSTLISLESKNISNKTLDLACINPPRNQERE